MSDVQAATVVDTMFKLVRDPEDSRPFVADVLSELRRGEEIPSPEVRAKLGEAMSTVLASQGGVGEVLRREASPEAVGRVLLSSLASFGVEPPPQVASWISAITSPLFASGRPRLVGMVAPYLQPLMPQEVLALDLRLYFVASS